MLNERTCFLIDNRLNRHVPSEPRDYCEYACCPTKQNLLYNAIYLYIAYTYCNILIIYFKT